MAVKKKPGSQNPPPDDDDDDIAGGGTITDDMRTEIINLVNAAVGSKITKRVPAIVAEALQTGLKPLQDQIASLGSRRRDDSDDDNDDDDQDQQQQQRGKNKGKPARKDPEVEGMRKQLAKLTEEREQERTQARNRERDTLLREQLEGAGVDKNRIRGAVAVLRDSMKYDDKAGEWVYNAKRDGYEEPVDVSAGVSEWAGTDEGKSYLAPPSNGGQQRGGSGVRPTGGGNGGTPRLQNGGRPIADPKQAKAQAKADAVQNLSKAIDSLGGSGIPLG